MLLLKEKFAKNYINAIGWRNKQKFVLIESDDWGAVRMPSKSFFNLCQDNRVVLKNNYFDVYDSLETSDDLEALFQLLLSLEDSTGNPAVLTAYHVVANPNFELIEKNGRNEYVYETIIESYKRHTYTQGSFSLIQNGIQKGIYIPQFHGREHIHVSRWMEAINSKSSKENFAFENKAIISVGSEDDKNPYKKDYFFGFNYENDEGQIEIEKIQQDGLRLFKNIFGMDSITFTAQGSIWGDHILPLLNKEGVRLIGGQQRHPMVNGKLKIINNYWGTRNYLGQVHWRRNVLFEPSRDQDFDWVSKCISEMEIAFRWGKPAVISSHRVNYMGSIFEENRTQSLKKLEILLKRALHRWPDIRFICSRQLAQIMY